MSNPVFLVIKKKEVNNDFFFFVLSVELAKKVHSIPASTKCYDLVLVSNQEDSA